MFRKAKEKDAAMTFEQPGELSQYLNPAQKSEALSQFWQGVKIFSPTIFVNCFVLLEVRWMKGLPFVKGLVLVVLVHAALLLLFWYEIRKEDRSKRTLAIHDDGLSLSGTPVRRVRWRWIRCFRVEPGGPQGTLEKLTVRYVSGGESRRSWSMIFANAYDRDALLSELKKRPTTGRGQWRFEILKVPTNFRGKVCVASRWLYMLSILPLLHGLPLLVATFIPAEEPPRATPEALGHAIRAFVRWFPRGVDPDRVFMMTGAALTVIGAGGFLWAGMLLRRESKIAEAEEAEDIKKKIEAAGGTIEIK